MQKILQSVEKPQIKILKNIQNPVFPRPASIGFRFTAAPAAVNHNDIRKLGIEGGDPPIRGACPGDALLTLEATEGLNDRPEPRKSAGIRDEIRRQST